MKTQRKRQMVKLQGSGTIGQLLGQYLLSDKSKRRDVKFIEELTGLNLYGKNKRTRKKSMDKVMV